MTGFIFDLVRLMCRSKLGLVVSRVRGQSSQVMPKLMLRLGSDAFDDDHGAFRLIYLVATIPQLLEK